MEEQEHIKKVINTTKEAIIKKDSLLLNSLSNQTIHTASCMQDPGSITLTVIIYALSKLIERRDYNKIKNWSLFTKKLILNLNLAMKASEEKNQQAYESYLERVRKLFTTLSINIKPYIEEVLRKSSINKANKIYEHGISLGQTSKLLGITQWELLEYTGQRQNPYLIENKTSNVRKRTDMALEFFS